MREKLQGTVVCGAMQKSKVWSKAARSNCTGAVVLEQNCSPDSLVWGRLTWITSSPLPDPLLPLMLGTGTWQEASDYFIAEFRAASGAVLSTMPLRGVSLCFD